MLKLFVLDHGAESRSTTLARVRQCIELAASSDEILPRIEVVPTSLQEIQFLGTPDLCLIGDELVTRDLADVGTVRRLLPQSRIIVCLPKELDTLGTIEHLARLGADDVLKADAEPVDLIRKCLLLARRRTDESSGELILVESGKGGVGATSITAALGEALLDSDKRVLLVDLDSGSQSLSRFLQARPFVNENLQLLLDGSRSPTPEFVRDCVVKVWHGDHELWCLPPPPESEELLRPRAAYHRALISILEILDEQFDVILVDTAKVRGPLLRTLCKVADSVLFVVSNDPSSLFASVSRVRTLRSLLAEEAPIRVIENSLSRDGLSSSLLQQELSRTAGLRESDGHLGTLDYCRFAHQWPGSGGTMYSLGSAGLRFRFDRMIRDLDMSTRDVIDPRVLTRLRDTFVGAVTWLRTNLRRRAAREARSERQPRSASALSTNIAGAIEAPIDTLLPAVLDSDDVCAPTSTTLSLISPATIS